MVVRQKERSDRPVHASLRGRDVLLWDDTNPKVVAAQASRLFGIN